MQVLIATDKEKSHYLINDLFVVDVFAMYCLKGSLGKHGINTCLKSKAY